MKKLFVALAVSLFALGTSAQTVDVSKSTIHWKGEKVTGFHEGNISLKSANFVEKGGTITEGTFIVDMNSMTCTDLADAEYNAKLIGHLKSDDFFGTDKHPEAVIKITKASAFKNGEATVEANLTIKGKTNPITFTVKKDGSTYTAKLVVNRAKYDVKYGSGTFFEGLGDKMIYDDFTLTISIATK